VDTVQNVVKVPNTALRYKPPMSPEEIIATYKQYGIDGSARTASDASGVVNAAQAAPGNPVPPRAPKADSAVVWKLHSDNTLEPVKISIGITDHAYTQVAAVLKGELTPGDNVVIRSVTPKTQGPGALRR
jgi:hypothetical protein